MSGFGKAFGLWRSTATDWRAYTHHAFVEGLCDGSLPRDAFLHYLKQDYVFLVHFSRAWGLAIAKSATLGEMQAASATVHALLHHEMALHVEVCAAAGIEKDVLEATRERAENMAYTRFVLEAGYSGDLLDLLAALAPCVLGYGEIGARLAGTRHDPTYAEWIATYGGAEYQEVCQETGALIDSALTHRLGASFVHAPRFGHLATTFAKATTLEVGFWEMGLRP